jgi:antitoxin (DNA-binding transcriptional repressor) of toxin-antitoxin stability system
MIKTVTVEELRENLDEVLSEVESGSSITIVRGGRSIGTLGPTIVQRGMRYPFRGLEPGTGSKELADEAVRLLIEERDYERSGKKFGA